MKFTRSHEWIIVNEDIGTVGISCFAIKEIGEIVYLTLPKIGDVVASGQEVVVLESLKAAIDIYSPVSGEICAVNQRVTTQIDLVNQFSETEGWLFKIRIGNQDELESLLSQEQYKMVVS